MHNTESYQVNAPSIVHETIDGEVVIANISNGNYYSIQDIGTFAWEMITNGATREQIITAIKRLFPTKQKEITEAINEFITELQKEELIFSSGVKEQLDNNTTTNLTIPSAPTTFTKPKLEKFTDMQALLMLDPIHEVDVTGWPNESKQVG